MCAEKTKCNGYTNHPTDSIFYNDDTFLTDEVLNAIFESSLDILDLPALELTCSAFRRHALHFYRSKVKRLESNQFRRFWVEKNDYSQENYHENALVFDQILKKYVDLCPNIESLFINSPGHLAYVNLTGLRQIINFRSLTQLKLDSLRFNPHFFGAFLLNIPQLEHLQLHSIDLPTLRPNDARGVEQIGQIARGFSSLKRLRTLHFMDFQNGHVLLNFDPPPDLADLALHQCYSFKDSIILFKFLAGCQNLKALKLDYVQANALYYQHAFYAENGGVEESNDENDDYDESDEESEMEEEQYPTLEDMEKLALPISRNLSILCVRNLDKNKVLDQDYAYDNDYLAMEKVDYKIWLEHVERCSQLTALDFPVFSKNFKILDTLQLIEKRLPHLNELNINLDVDDFSTINFCAFQFFRRLNFLGVNLTTFQTTTSVPFLHVFQFLNDVFQNSKTCPSCSQQAHHQSNLKCLSLQCKQLSQTKNQSALLSGSTAIHGILPSLHSVRVNVGKITGDGSRCLNDLIRFFRHENLRVFELISRQCHDVVNCNLQERLMSSNSSQLTPTVQKVTDSHLLCLLNHCPNLTSLALNNLSVCKPYTVSMIGSMNKHLSQLRLCWFKHAIDTNIEIKAKHFVDLIKICQRLNLLVLCYEFYAELKSDENFKRVAERRRLNLECCEDFRYEKFLNRFSVLD